MALYVLLIIMDCEVEIVLTNTGRKGKYSYFIQVSIWTYRWLSDRMVGNWG
jgi:hypothetical protein